MQTGPYRDRLPGIAAGLECGPQLARPFFVEGADIFNIKREGIIFSHEEALAMRGRPRLTRDDARFLRTEATNFDALVESADGTGRAEYGNEAIGRVNIEGRSWEWALLDGTGLRAGRYFSPQETDRARAVAVIGLDTADNLFPVRYLARAFRSRC